MNQGTDYRDSMLRGLKERHAAAEAERLRQETERQQLEIQERRKRQLNVLGLVGLGGIAVTVVVIAITGDRGATLDPTPEPPCGRTRLRLLAANPQPTWTKDQAIDGYGRLGIWDGRICTFAYPSRPIFCVMECGPHLLSATLTVPQMDVLAPLPPPVDAGVDIQP